MAGFISDSPLARELIRIGDEAIAREDDVKLRAYFADDYVFHGPGGDLLPQLLDQARRDHDGVRPTGNAHVVLSDSTLTR